MSAFRVPRAKVEFTLSESDAGSVVPLAVLAPLRFGPPSLTGNQLTLSWGAAPGQTYQVVYSGDLSPGSWQLLPGAENLLAGGSGSLSVTVNVSGTPHQRFYRIRLVQ